MTATPHSTFRLSEEAKRLLAQLSRYYGLTNTGTLEWLIREQARRVPRKRPRTQDR